MCMNSKGLKLKSSLTIYPILIHSFCKQTLKVNANDKEKNTTNRNDAETDGQTTSQNFVSPLKTRQSRQL